MPERLTVPVEQTDAPPVELRQDRPVELERSCRVNSNKATGMASPRGPDRNACGSATRVDGATTLVRSTTDSPSARSRTNTAVGGVMPSIGTWSTARPFGVSRARAVPTTSPLSVSASNKNSQDHKRSAQQENRSSGDGQKFFS
jgi:hypothetical protein